MKTKNEIFYELGNGKKEKPEMGKGKSRQLITRSGQGFFSLVELPRDEIGAKGS